MRALPSSRIEALPGNSKDTLGQRLVPDERVRVGDASRGHVDPQKHARNGLNPASKAIEVLVCCCFEDVSPLCVEVCHGPCVAEEPINAPSLEELVGYRLR